MIVTSNPTYIGLRTWRLNPDTTRRSVGASGTGVPPALTNSANAEVTGTRPAPTSTAPTIRAAPHPGSGRRNRHRVISHGIRPTAVPGATTKNPAETSVALDLCMSVLLCDQRTASARTAVTNETACHNALKAYQRA